MTSQSHEAMPDPEDPVHGAAEEEAATEAVSDPVSEPPVEEDVDRHAGEEPESTEPSIEQQLAERTADLQRLQAEFLNYKRRVDRDRDVIRNTATGTVLTAVLPVLDDIGRAREHDELHGGFKAVADSLVKALEPFGLEPFGEEGDLFDPTVHEAMLHGYSTEVSEPVADKILQVGYRIGEKVLRPARVSVVEPGENAEESQEQPAQQ